MIKKLISLIITMVILQLLPIVEFSNVTAFMLSTTVLAILMYCIEPILRLLSMPLNVATFGLFRIVLLVGSLWLTTFLIPGFMIYPMILLGIKLHYFYTLIFVSTVMRGLHSIITYTLRLF